MRSQDPDGDLLTVISQATNLVVQLPMLRSFKCKLLSEGKRGRSSLGSEATAMRPTRMRHCHLTVLMTSWWALSIDKATTMTEKDQAMEAPNSPPPSQLASA